MFEFIIVVKTKLSCVYRKHLLKTHSTSPSCVCLVGVYL
nr:MAG TPA_asm: hypothetical protein [Caudoviricetes sp.]